MRCIFRISREVWLSAIILLLFRVAVSAQDYWPFADRVKYATTPIETYHDGDTFYGSGFYYSLVDTNASSNLKVLIDSIMLVSAKHVLVPYSVIPDSICVFVPSINSDSTRAALKKLCLTRKFLKDKLLVSNDGSVDVAIVNLGPDFTSMLNGLYLTHPIDVFRKYELQRYLDVSQPIVSDRAIIVGHPKDFYDDFNSNPIVKSAFIASFYGPHYKGQPKFILDRPMNNSYSGAAVLHSPNESIKFDTVNGLRFRQGRPLCLIGIYTGEPIVSGEIEETEDAYLVKKIRMDLGNVYYPSVIDSIVINGINVISK